MEGHPLPPHVLPRSAADLVWACCWMAAVVFAVRAANIVALWNSTRPASKECVQVATAHHTSGAAGREVANPPPLPPPLFTAFRRQAKLQPALRKLMGLPPAPPK
jgi:hypothetical protein